MRSMLWFAVLSLSLGLAPLSVLGQGLSFSLTSTPTQCEDLSISWSGGTPPYEVTIIPLYEIGAFPTSTWNLTVTDVNTTETSWSGTLPLPGGSPFVVVLSDETGFGSGGTSEILTVGDSSDSSCNPPSTIPTQSYFVTLSSVLSQCEQADILLAGFNLTSPPSISAVVPGGPSMVLASPELALLVQGVSGYYLTWTVDMPEGMQAIFLGGDTYGRASGGWTGVYTIVNGTESDCLTNSPFVVAQSTPSTGTSHVGAIVGGVIGGVAGLLLLVLLAMFLIRRRNIRVRRRSIHEKAARLRMYPLEGFNREDAPKGMFGSE